MHFYKYIADLYVFSFQSEEEEEAIKSMVIGGVGVCIQPVTNFVVEVNNQNHENVTTQNLRMVVNGVQDQQLYLDLVILRVVEYLQYHLHQKQVNQQSLFI